MTPGVFKAFLYHAELKKIKSNWIVAQTNETLSCRNENLRFYFYSNHGNKQYFMYWNFFESVYILEELLTFFESVSLLILKLQLHEFILI